MGPVDTGGFDHAVHAVHEARRSQAARPSVDTIICEQSVLTVRRIQP